MKKMLCIVFGVSLLALVAACGRSGESKPSGQEEAPQQAPATQPPAATASPETTPPPPAPTEAETPPPAKPKPQLAAPSAAPAPAPSPEAKAEPAPAPAVKVKKAGLGVIFVGNLPQGTFRVKADNTVLYELAFSGKETRSAKEFYLEPGQHLMRFVVIDDKGVRGVKEENMTFVSGKHQTVRVSVKDTPGALIVEHLE